ncbi:Mom family adenine methylcarbamoylation protein [Sphingobium sp.]|uniref:Mom family adenine methylcarbamoylation protein n=1 Tax=Sphingobium sp. TaxID=1912891 RepID=UPI002E1F43C6
MHTSRSQRWRDRRALWATDFRTIDTKAYSVDVIDHGIAGAFIAAHHYLPTYPAAQLAVGLYGRRAALEGVAVFAVPATNAVIVKHTGFDDPAKGCVLARLILLDTVPQNGESFFCARAFRLLRRARPAIEAVVSYSDPEAGHIGRVYAALSGAHRGISRPRRIWHMGERTISERTLSKIRLGERGMGGAIDQLVGLGARAPLLRECPAAWLAGLQEQGVLASRRHRGLFTYCFELTREARRQGQALPRLPYPKILPGQ